MDTESGSGQGSYLERAARWLVLPVAVLLFLQWPLRELVQAGSREANDLGQWLFAFYVAVAVAAASRAGAHIATDTWAKSYNTMTRARLAAGIALAGLIPWALWTLWIGIPIVSRSALQLERFPDTLNPGYFLVKAAFLVLLVTMTLAAIRDVLIALNRARVDKP